MRIEVVLKGTWEEPQSYRNTPLEHADGAIRSVEMALEDVWLPYRGPWVLECKTFGEDGKEVRSIHAHVMTAMGPPLQEEEGKE